MVGLVECGKSFTFLKAKEFADYQLRNAVVKKGTELVAGRGWQHRAALTSLLYCALDTRHCIRYNEHTSPALRAGRRQDIGGQKVGR